MSVFVYSVLIPIWLMAVSCPGNCFTSYTQKILFKYTGAVWRDRGLIGKAYYMLNFDVLKIAKVVPREICPWDIVGAVYIRIGLNINNYHATPLTTPIIPSVLSRSKNIISGSYLGNDPIRLSCKAAIRGELRRRFWRCVDNDPVCVISVQ